MDHPRREEQGSETCGAGAGRSKRPGRKGGRAVCSKNGPEQMDGMIAQAGRALEDRSFLLCATGSAAHVVSVRENSFQPWSGRCAEAPDLRHTPGVA